MFGGLTVVKLTASLTTLMWAISLCAIKVKETSRCEIVRKLMCCEMNHKLMCCQINNTLIYREVGHNLTSFPVDHKLTNVDKNEGLLLQNC